MKRVIFFVSLALISFQNGFAEESSQPAPEQTVVTEQIETVTEVRTEKIAFVEKMIELPELISAEGTLKEAIGIETLAGIVTPIIKSGSVVPAGTSLKLGISSACNCAKLKLFRVSSEPGKKPVEISHDAIRGFSADDKLVNITLEVQADSRLHLKVETPAKLEPGKLLEWMPAKEMLPVTQVTAAKDPVAAVESKPVDLIQTWEIADHRVDCQAVAPMKCLIIKKTEKDAPELFYDSIKGFDYEEGFDYVVKVKETPVVNPPADASSLAYELIELVSKTPVVSKIEVALNDIWVLSDGQAESLKNPSLKPRPVLELHVKEAKVMGQAPCNQYQGDFQAAPSGGGLRFGNIMVTRKACEFLQAEADYFKLLQSVESYRREELELVLESGGKEILRFKKVD